MSVLEWRHAELGSQSPASNGSQRARECEEGVTSTAMRTVPSTLEQAHEGSNTTTALRAMEERSTKASNEWQCAAASSSQGSEATAVCTIPLPRMVQQEMHYAVNCDNITNVKCMVIADSSASMEGCCGDVYSAYGCGCGGVISTVSDQSQTLIISYQLSASINYQLTAAAAAPQHPQRHSRRPTFSRPPLIAAFIRSLIQPCHSTRLHPFHLTATPHTACIVLVSCCSLLRSFSAAMSHTDDVSAPIRRLADLDLSDTKGDAAHYDDDNSTYHSQLYTGPIVDPHIHFFDFEQQSYPWLKGPEQIPTHPLVGNIDMLRAKSYLLVSTHTHGTRME